jgi:hypothetical protein
MTLNQALSFCTQELVGPTSEVWPCLWLPQGKKSKLTVKPDKFEEAKAIFKDTEIELTNTLKEK